MEANKRKKENLDFFMKRKLKNAIKKSILGLCVSYGYISLAFNSDNIIAKLLFLIIGLKYGGELIFDAIIAITELVNTYNKSN